MAKFTAATAQSAQRDDSNNFDLGSESYAPTIMWMKGNPTVGKAIAKLTKTKPNEIEDISYHGGFFITENNVPNDESGEPIDLTAYGWTVDAFESQSTNKEIQGYSRKSMRVAAINMRLGFQVRDVGIFPTYNEAEKHGRPSGVIHVLVVIEGMEQLGKFILTLNGHAQMALTGAGKYKGKSVFDEFQHVLKAAQKVSPGKYPYSAFWMGIAASNDNGVPRFVVAGSGENSSQIIIPQYAGPTSEKDVDLDDVYVGEKLQKTFDEILEDSAEWAAEWKVAKSFDTDDTADEDEDEPEVEEASELFGKL